MVYLFSQRGTNMVGEKIKQRRKELGWTQEELAKRTGCGTKATVCRYENGTRDLSQSMLKKFAEVLGVEPNYFFFDIVETQEELFERNKVLFDLSKKCKPEDLEVIIKIVERMTDEE